MRCLFVLFVASLVLLLYPAFIIQPFRAQDQTALLLSLALKRWSPLATLAIFVGGAVLSFYERGRWWQRAGAYFVVLLLGTVAALARVNYFELMFHPNPAPQFVAATDAKLDPDDMVLIARVGKECRAYPVRIMAYHHLVNDTVGGVPLVATY